MYTYSGFKQRIQEFRPEDPYKSLQGVFIWCRLQRWHNLKKSKGYSVLLQQKQQENGWYQINDNCFGALIVFGDALPQKQR